MVIVLAEEPEEVSEFAGQTRSSDGHLGQLGSFRRALMDVARSSAYAVDAHLQQPAHTPHQEQSLHKSILQNVRANNETASVMVTASFSPSMTGPFAGAPKPSGSGKLGNVPLVV